MFSVASFSSFKILLKFELRGCFFTSTDKVCVKVVALYNYYCPQLKTVKLHPKKIREKRKHR